MLATFAFVMLFLATSTKSYASTMVYSINDETIENLFDAGTQVVALEDSEVFAGFLAGLEDKPATKVGSKDGAVATIVCFFLGSLGIHRAYLGTSAGVIVGYILTCGGCGILQTVDFIVLLMGAIDGDVSKYENNKKFFMW